MRMTTFPPRVRQRGMAGLGQWESLIPVAASLLSKGGSGGGGGGAPGVAVTTTVSPTIQTQINPQISPVFQQSYMPSNSGMTAGTSQFQPTEQSAPRTPGSSSSYIPNAYGEPMPSVLDPSTYTPPGIFAQGGQRPGSTNWTMWIIGGIAVLAAVFLLTGRKSHSEHSERVSEKAREADRD